MTRRATLVPLFGLALLAGCATFPELDAAATARLPGTSTYSEVIPNDEVLARAGTPTLTEPDRAALDARVAGLQARAAALQGPVVDAETAARLQAAGGG